ncbi:MAG: carbohydrate-binding protein [Lachnospiraceae bacterium]|nr:carbohydrate-binding protein [Lachnospiraceae bacterium]
MANPYLPGWEYIPDGEPRVFGNRVYIYGSHDTAGSDMFCDYKLKVWSAPVDNLNDWVCHGDIFHTRRDLDHESDTPWTDGPLYAPDVVEKDGSYYLYAYIFGAKGCVAKSDRPEGPFTLISKYQIPENAPQVMVDGWFVDPGVLVDDDGRVYVYCGFEQSFMAEIEAENMTRIKPGSYIPDIIPTEEPFSFFEACSLRKIKDTYYLIYSPRTGSRLVYATSDSPTGPFTYRGIIVDNGVEYPGGNNHGSICNIKGQWYIFYHRMTNHTIMSRRACVEKIEILPDGTIPQVEMTSLGFEESLSPYREVKADIACVLKGGCYITEKNRFVRPIVNITEGCVIGFKYFEFGQDNGSSTMEFIANVEGSGSRGKMHIHLDAEDGDEIGICEIGADDGLIKTVVASVTGRHAVYFVFEGTYGGWFKESFDGKIMCNLISFTFIK